MKPGYTLSLIAASAAILVFVIQGSLQPNYSLIVDILIDIFSGAALASAVFSLMRYERGLGTRSGAVWWSFTGGIFLWFLGEVTWSVYSDLLNVPVPYPSLADAFYLAGYFPLFAGFYVYMTYFRQAFSRRMILASLGIIIVSAVLVFVFLLGPVLATEENQMAKVFDFAYPLLDLVLLSVTILGLGLLVRGRLGTAWLFFTAGVLMNVFGDMVFSYTTAQGAYHTGSLPDLFFLEGYVAFALAFYLHRKEL